MIDEFSGSVELGNHADLCRHDCLPHALGSPCAASSSGTGLGFSLTDRLGSPLCGRQQVTRDFVASLHLAQLALAVVIVAVLSPSLYSIMGAITLVSWPPAARLVRSEFMTLKQREFVLAAVVVGQKPGRIVWSQILPNAMSPIIVSASFMVATAILTESALSFLGLGDRNMMSWGFMIGAARTMIREAWWMSVWPGVAILLTVLAINLIGEGLNDALNPQLRKRGE